MSEDPSERLAEIKLVEALEELCKRMDLANYKAKESSPLNEVPELKGVSVKVFLAYLILSPLYLCGGILLFMALPVIIPLFAICWALSILDDF